MKDIDISTSSEDNLNFYFGKKQNKMCNVNLFDSRLSEKKKNNKMESDNFYQDVKYDILRIERNINTEVKKRIEENKNIQQLIERSANDMINNVLNKITTKIENISLDLDKIIKKCEELEKGTGQIKVDLPTKIQAELITLKREIFDFHIIINKYLHNKKKRDNILFGKIENIDAYINSKIQSEISFKHEDLLILKNESEKLLNYDLDDDINFKNLFIDEIEEIKDALSLTIKEREKSDDDIIQAMNKYTSILQKALQSVIARSS
ncbi:SF-assemblin, putative [Plasmodium berghei]|uniref:SF-assemblin, putative n=2 Tax=Plasmodium berghei TaxID=5821 RepID=A0A509AKQ0_PLABA|nr:SF-assemblin, putative [Plasmodium berghei ANKA]CXI50859.1 SF-assemblin, putative [Plasmodium berghei]SCL94338.1 SF-assemblin, putative [Plasmodium berghei]SCM15994.1 SF-assemblin, putative [Plasmodium berghei]SCM17790.1 SF-assemblin, putative [Plasmodium berghei]SCN26026.1 SF-assemblin, putative [Plasmodium berghei]|eukprot:XP_034421919.1 SF-assemblin, putative [Plasmodium berghei ANKA]